MKLNNLLKAITLALVVNGSWANQREEIQLMLQAKLQSLATETDEKKQKELKLSITQLRNMLNRESMMTDVDSNNGVTANSPIGSINPELKRDTFFYRGPVRNHSSFNGNLSTSWDARGYGGNTQFREGAPVHAINAMNAHTNVIPGQTARLHRNPFTNPDYKAGQQFYQTNRPGVNYQPNHWQNGFNPNFGNGFNNPWGQQFHRPYQNSWNGYGNNQNYGPYQSNSVIQQQQSRERATYDAKVRLQQELQADPRFVSNNRINVMIDSVSEIANNQIQVVARITGGVTGQNRNEQRVYIYTQAGSFVKHVENVQGPVNTGNQTIRVQNYDLSNNQKFSIDRYLAERGFNQYGDPRGTMYAGGNPLGLINDGGAQSRENLRFNYILNNHKELLSLFQIQQ
ncbi:MAG: hypothetical protein KC646_10670 [Candidatus Cloacimonetes bacterium]|nr:hypothetical protein [Candidatus Cloacimonadota bacterium]